MRLLLQCIYLFYPETANRSLEDFDRLYRENKSLVIVCRDKEATQVARPQRFVDEDEKRADGQTVSVCEILTKSESDLP